MSKKKRQDEQAFDWLFGDVMRQHVELVKARSLAAGYIAEAYRSTGVSGFDPPPIPSIVKALRSFETDVLTKLHRQLERAHPEPRFQALGSMRRNASGSSFGVVPAVARKNGPTSRSRGSVFLWTYSKQRSSGDRAAVAEIVQVETHGKPKAAHVVWSNEAGAWAHRLVQDFNEAFKIPDTGGWTVEKELRRLFASQKKSARGLARKIVALFTDLSEEQVRKLETTFLSNR